MTLTRDQVLAQTIEILKRHTKGEVNLGAATQIVADLGIDSLGVMEALAEVEDAFGIAFDDEELQGMSTLGELAELATRKIAAGAARE